MDTASLVKELTEARGPSGREAAVRRIVRERLSAHADEMREDAMGSLVSLKKGFGPAPRPSIMLAGHMDEIALWVTHLEKGFLGITATGFDARVLFGQKVTVHGRRDLPGLVVSVPPHFLEPADQEKPVPIEKLFVDVGLPADEVGNLVRVGDVITLDAGFIPLAGGYAASKSLDDRAAVAMMILCLEHLSQRSHAWDVYAVATVQEETGLKGALTSAYGVAPDAGLAIDVTFGQQPGVSGPETAKMDGGPTVSLGPNFHPRIFERLVAAAKAIEIPFQVDPVPGASGTDAWAMQVARGGVPCGLLSIPVRAMHTPVETVALRDIERAARLAAEFICRLEPDFAGSLVVKDALALPPAHPAPAAPGAGAADTPASRAGEGA